MPYCIIPGHEYAECPCCKKKVVNKNEIERLFDWRKLHNGKVIPQSYYKSCRGADCKGNLPCKVLQKCN